MFLGELPGTAGAFGDRWAKHDVKNQWFCLNKNQNDPEIPPGELPAGREVHEMKEASTNKQKEADGKVHEIEKGGRHDIPPST